MTFSSEISRIVRRCAAMAMLCQVCMSAYSRDYYISPMGSADADGSKESPYGSLSEVLDFIEPGDNVWFYGGVYHLTNDDISSYDEDGIWAYVYQMDHSGAPGMPITFAPVDKASKVVIDLSDVKPTNRRILVFNVTANYLYFRDFEIIGTQVTILKHTQSECFRIDGGCYNTFEHIACHDGMAIGFYMTGGRYNTIVNCDVYNNKDMISEDGRGGNVDGFGVHLSSQADVGNVLRGCRAWNNSDDGFDLIRCWAPVVVDNCWSFYNGYEAETMRPLGDGTGFKAGGFGMRNNTSAPYIAPRHTISNSIAYANKHRGFYANHHTGGLDFINNRSMNNVYNYVMLNRKSVAEVEDVPGYGHRLMGNISYAATKSDIIHCDSSACTFIGNTFNYAGNTSALTERHFKSLDASVLTMPRKADGSLPDIDFMMPTDKLRRQYEGLLEASVPAIDTTLSALNRYDFSQHWLAEGEFDMGKKMDRMSYKVKFFGDTLQLLSPKGMSLWRKEKMRSGVTIEYDVCVLEEGQADRVSDLNCFWLVNDPKAIGGDVWERFNWRAGNFAKSYSLRLYYLGYGGNGNTTTRFRRYDGNEEATYNYRVRPAILMEYTDDEHLIVPNHWYHVKIVTTTDGHQSYSIDGKAIVDYYDAEPIESGWFAFRTTTSRVKICNFRYYY